MGDDDGGAVAHHKVQSLLDQNFRFGIDIGGGFIENQNIRLHHHGPGKGEQLALAHGKVGAAFIQARVITLRQPFYKGMGVHLFTGLNNLFPADLLVAQPYIFQNAAGKKKDILQHQGHGAAQVPQVVRAYVPPVDLNTSFLNIILPAQQIYQRAFTRAGMTDNGDTAFRGHLKTDIP